MESNSAERQDSTANESDITDLQAPISNLAKLEITDHEEGKDEVPQTRKGEVDPKYHGAEIKESKVDFAHEDDLNFEEETKDKNKKKKSKKSGGSKAKKPKPTGFEEYYVEAPRTAEEFEEEKHLYSLDKPFTERFTLAVARYTSRRRFDPLRANVFDKYMAFGMMTTKPKMFQGRVDEKDSGMTPADAALLKSKYSIRSAVFDPENEFKVGFDHIAQGFLTSNLLNFVELHREEDFKTCINVVRNFLNYLLHHDVCPDFADQLYNAKAICDEADHQLPICAKLARILPGNFNKACSILFGGFHQDTYIDDPEIARSLNLEPGMRIEDAQKIFLAGLAVHGSDEMVDLYNEFARDPQDAVIEKVEGYLEVVSTSYPSQNALDFYNMDLNNIHDAKPIGKVTLSYWRHPKGPFPQMSPEEVRIYRNAPYERPEFEFLLDADLLPLMTPGTKILCTYRKTSFGIRYFDNILAVLSPMYLWSKMEGWSSWVTPEEIPYKEKSARKDYFDGAIAHTGEPNDEGGDTKVVSKDMSQEVANQDGDGDSESDEDVPHEFKKYEKGEDIILTL